MCRSLALTMCCVVVVGGVGRAQEDASRFVTLRGMVIDTSFRPVPGVLVYLSWGRQAVRAFAPRDARATPRPLEAPRRVP